MSADPENLEITLVGKDGRRYVLVGENEGVEGVRLASGSLGTAFEDMYEAPVDTIYQSTAFGLGGQYNGLRENMFEFTLAFHVKNTTDRPWRINDSRFRKSLSYKQDAFLHVKIVGESERYLTVRLRSAPKLKVDTDPNGQRYGLLLVHFVAPYPRWQEDDWTSSYTTTTNTQVSGTEIGTVTLYNPTNVECWAKWVLQAGNAGIVYTLPDFSWGDDRFDRGVADASRMIVMPSLVLNEHVVVDTDEMTTAGQVNSSLDTAIYLRMNGREFLYPIPPYTDPTPMTISIQHADIGNIVQVRCPRSWSRPWGLE